MTGQVRPDHQFASAQVSGSGPSVWQTGSTLNVLRTGVGVYQVTVEPANQSQHVIQPTPLTAFAHKAVIEPAWLSPSLIQFQTFIWDTLTDCDFEFAIERCNTGDVAIPAPVPAAFIPPSGGGGVNSVTTRNGLTNAGTAADPILDVVPGDGSLIATPGSLVVGVISDVQHGARGGGALHALAVAGGAAGFMSGADKLKLDGITPGAAVASVTAGAGLINSGTATNPILDVGAANTSITVNANDVQLGTPIPTVHVFSNTANPTLTVNGTLVLNTTATNLSMVQGVSAGATVTSVSWTGGAHTAIPAGVENVDLNWNGNRIVQWAAGALATQRFIRVQQPTLAFVGASIVSLAATISIGAKPLAGTNATVTSAYQLLLEGTVAGATRMGLGTDGATAAVDPQAVWNTGGGGVAFQGTETYTTQIASFTSTRRAYLNVVNARIQSQGSASNSLCIGLFADDGGSNAISIGYGAYAASGSTAVGLNAWANASNAVVVNAGTGSGTSTTITGSDGIAVGNTNTLSHLRGIQIGGSCTSTADDQAIVKTLILALGNGASTTTPTASVTIRGTDTSGASADKAGTSLVYQGGISSGTGAGGSHTFRTSPASTVSGTTLNTLGTRLAIDQYGTTTITPAVAATGIHQTLVATGAAHTAQTASTELIDVQYSLNRTVQFATGALTTERAYYVQAPTYAFVGASTITTASTVAISGPPVAGANATITTAYSLQVESGLSGFGGNIDMTAAAPIIRATSANVTITLRGNQNAGSSGVDVVLNSQVTRTAGNLVSFQNNATTRASVQFHGGITVNQANVATGALQMLVLTGGSLTNQTLSTEINFVDVNQGTVQWATGAIATQRCYRFRSITLAFVGASTITDAATLYVEGAPIAGTNATITNPYSFWIDAGLPRIDSTTANGAVATVLGAVGPAGSNTTVQEWFTVSINGTTRFIPCF